MRLAALQMRAVAGDIDANLARIGQAAHESAQRGASILVAPELAITGYGAGDVVRATAQTVEGDQIARLAKIATSAGIAVLAGFAEKDGAMVRNAAIYVDGQNRPVIYRKSHLYGSYEHELFTAADPATVIMERDGLRLGILICYDVEFPENVRRLALAGADVVLVPTALPADEEGAFVARKLLPVRAFENRIHIVYANHCGSDGRFSFAGLSLIAAPDGSFLAEAGAENESVLVGECVPARFAALTSQLDSLSPHIADLPMETN